MQFIKKIQNFAFQNNLWEKNSKIIVGVSGGPDSTCLLDVLAKLAPKYGFQLHVAHVNYNLRGKNSIEDEKFVRELAKNLGLEVSVLNVKNTQYKGNLEDELRKIRYAFFEKIRKSLKYDLIAVAHNQDDQAETVLMRIMRGSGLSGLAAIKAKNGNIVRPLLQISKIEILTYLKQNKLKFRIDESNVDLRFDRNKIRHELIPYLEDKFNPAIKKTIANWSLIVAEEYDFIEKSAQDFLSQMYKNKSVTFQENEFFCLHGAVQRQVLREIFSRLSKGVLIAESRQVEEMIKVIGSTKNKTQKALIGGLNIIKKGDRIEISI